MLFEELAHMVADEGDDPVALLMFAGLLRDDFPWLSELVLEVYRELREGDAKAAQKALERLHRVTRLMGRGRFIEEFGIHSKEAHMMMMEIPMMLEHFIHRLDVRRLKASEDTITDNVDKVEE